MLYPVTGCRTYISLVPLSDTWGASDTPPTTGWTEIGEVEALGTLGFEWSLDETEDHYIGDGGGRAVFMKRTRRDLPMQIMLGNDPSDPGQQQLWQAAKAINAYCFRLVFPDGVTRREWFAYVMSISEVFDAANSVMRLQVDLQPVTPRGT